MHILRRIAVLVSITFLFLLPVTSEAKPWSFTISPQIGFIYGQAVEIVYKSPNSNLNLSELLWDLKPLVYTGFSADFFPRDPAERHSFFTGLDFKCGLPLKAGAMEDRDWMNNKFDYFTHYSRHDAYSRHAVLIDLSTGYSWRLTSFLYLKAYADFSYMRFSWSAKDGYIQYPTYDSSTEYPKWTDNLPKNYIDGELIRYAQNWFIFSPGLTITAKLNRLFAFEGSFNISPFVLCADRDDHFERGRYFKDYLSGGRFVKSSGVLIFSPLKNFDVILDFSYSHITGTRGYVDTYSTGAYGDLYLGRDEGIAGAGYSSFDLGLAARIRLFNRQKTAIQN